MKACRHFILTLLVVSSPTLRAAEPAPTASLPAQQMPTAKPQQLSSPEQTPKGLSKSDWSNIRAAYEAGRHAFQSVEGGWQARNPGQQWITKFDHHGFLTRPREGNWQWGLELKSYGFGTEQQSIGGTPAVKAVGQRLSYQWDDSVQELFVNDQRGLEHGFTIGKRPAAASDSQPSTLNFLLSTRGTLHPSVTADAQGVLFQDDAGATVLNYTGLKVWDADGKALRSRFEAAGESDIRLRVEEQGARYPLTIDPIAQQAYLKSSNTGAGDNFGYSVSISGDTVVVGAPYEDSSTTGVNSTPNESATDSGAAYIFVRSGTTWSQQAYLKASNAGASDYFGYSVAVSGDTMVVGAYGEDSSTTGVNSTPNEGASLSGAAYVFTRSGTTWSQQAYLKASNTGASDQFGLSVAVSGDTVVVGAYAEDSGTTGVNSTPNESANDSGAAYVFTRSGTTWSQQAYLKASNPGGGDYFGAAVALSGDTVVVGAKYEDSSTSGVNSTPNESAIDSGAAYVFTRSGTTWSQQAYLKASNTGVGDEFGFTVAVSGDTVVVGAVFEASSTTGVNSSPNENANGSGAAYVFTRNGTTWSQQAFLKASNTGASDLFGYSVGVSGDTLVVGAPYEDSGTTGVNSTPNESVGDSGAAYVFIRSGTVWSQQAYLKASNPGLSDQFGYSVAVSGNTVVVGALGEDSGTSGVNSTPNESATDAGAAYIFTGLGPVPYLAGIYPAAGSTAGGTSVTISGTGFTGAIAVMIGGTPAANFTVNSSSSITATTPAHAMGTADVAVTNSIGTATGTNFFTYGPMAVTPAVSAGHYYSLFLKPDGTVWAAGKNEFAQLGDGTKFQRTTPVMVISSVKAIAAGESHSLFLKMDGSVWAVGANYFGQLGDGTTVDRTTPIQVLTGVQAIAVGTTHSLFLKADGTAWAAGNNYDGQLGDGTGGFNAANARATPVQVLTGVQAISANTKHSLFLKTDGTAWATGVNADGRLGDGTTTDRNAPVQVLSGVGAIYAGPTHSLFLKIDGSVWACGWNLYAQLGDGTFNTRTTPVQVLTGVKAISAGGYSSKFLKTDGTVWTTTTAGNKYPVQYLDGVQTISNSDTHVLFLKLDGSIYAVGSNYYGQYGNGASTNRPTPVQVLTGYTAIAAGKGQSLFLKSDGTVWAAGANPQGGFGTGIASQLSPIQVLSDVQAFVLRADLTPYEISELTS